MYPGTIAAQSPDRAAVIMAGSGEVVTYAELDRRSTQLARLLREAGLRRGDHVAVFLENHPRYMEVIWAGMRSGLYITTVNSYLSPGEVAYIVNDCGAQALVASRAKGDVVAALTGDNGIPGVHVRLMMDGAIRGFDAYEAAIDAAPAERLDDESLGAFMFYSSGTTGKPKGIMRPLTDERPDQPNPAMAVMAAVFGFRDGMTYLSPAPMYHAAPAAFVTATHRAGGTAVILEKFDPVRALESIERHRVTHSQWVPTMFVRMLKLPGVERLGHDLRSHEVAIHAAAPCPVEVKRRMIDWWGPILIEYYAGSEGNGSCIIKSDEWLAHPGSVGKPAGCRIHICDDEGGELAPGDEGVIYFSGGQSFEYHNDPEKTASSRLDGGRSTLGDIGYLDEEGYLYLTDRKAFMIISGGVNIYPREIEDVLVTHPKVADVAVIGVPNDEFGEEVKAVVQPADGVAPTKQLEQELMGHCRSQLAHFKCPRSVDFEAELPRLPTGKLYKRVLRDRYWLK
jgi:acyl-CoA synthetase (AMP-forming)/AMP-acid ligase II